jgi:hypothetical protein
MNRHSTPERYHDPMAMLTRCRLEELERDVAQHSLSQMVRVERTSPGTIAFHCLVHTWWQALRARTARAIGVTPAHKRHAAGSEHPA